MQPAALVEPGGAWEEAWIEMSAVTELLGMPFGDPYCVSDRCAGQERRTSLERQNLSKTRYWPLRGMDGIFVRQDGACPDSTPLARPKSARARPAERTDQYKSPKQTTATHRRQCLPI